MKTTVIASFLFLLVLSCSKNNPKEKIALDSIGMEKIYQSEKPVLEIEIINIPKDSLSEINVTYVKAPIFKEMQPSKNIPLNQNGKFILQLDYAIPNQEIFLTIGKLYYGSITLSKDLRLIIDYEKAKKKPIWNYDDSITFYGNDSDLNTIVAKYRVYNIDVQQKVLQDLMEISRKKFKDFSDFKSSLDSLNKILIEIEISFSKENKSNDHWYISHIRENEYYIQLLNYVQENKLSLDKETIQTIRSRKTFGVTNSSDQLLRNQIYSHYGIQKYTIDDWKKLYQFKNENSRRYSRLDDFLSLWQDKINEKPISEKEFDNLKFELSYSFINEWQLLAIEQYSKIIDSLYSPEKGDLLKLKLWSNDLTYFNYEYNKINKYLKTDWAKDILSKEKELLSNNNLKIQYKKDSFTIVNNHMKKFDFGATLYDFEEVESKEQLLSSILSLHKSKSKLIDFWATWCAPCFEEMKYSKRLYEKIDNKKLEFIYLCTSSNSNKTKWENTIVDLEQKGIHIYANQNVVNELMSELSINGFPSYALFNSKDEYLHGKITRMKTLTIEQLNEIINK